ncbi:hypothetical protein KAU11_08745 [Candidatus Babeliales bacterium]|nr:hypothetical protein [Candidatus Babeliales bacterium]
MKGRRHNEYTKTASMPHKLVGDALAKSSVFSGHKRFQEVSYSQIIQWAVGKEGVENVVDLLDVTRGEAGRWKADWVIKNLGIVIEVQGKQHKVPVAFGGNPMKAVQRFERQRSIDRDKEAICVHIDWTFVTIDSDELMNQSLFERTEWVEDVVCDRMAEERKKVNQRGGSKENVDK